MEKGNITPKEEIQRQKGKLLNRFEMRDLEELKYFIGMHIVWDRKN
jgi:hypothetical protein